MTRAQEIYADTLNLLGSDLLTDSQGEIQEMLDREHAAADPLFKLAMEKQKRLTESAAV